MQNQSLIKIQVIDEKLLIDGLHKNGINKKDEVAEYTQENTDAASLIEVIPNATTLIMSFKKINKIENLIGFNKLVKLCLDNNQIEKIANLSFYYLLLFYYHVYSVGFVFCYGSSSSFASSSYSSWSS